MTFKLRIIQFQQVSHCHCEMDFSSLCAGGNDP